MNSSNITHVRESLRSTVSSSYRTELTQEENSIDSSSVRTSQEVRGLLSKFSEKAPSANPQLINRLNFLFQGIVNRKERGRIYDIASSIKSSQLHSVLEQAYPFLENITDGYQKAAILDAISKTSPKDRACVARYASRFISSVRDGYHLSSIIRVIRNIPPSKRAQVFARAEVYLEEAQDGLHAAAILRACHASNRENVVESLYCSVGDPEVENLLQEWDLDATDVSPQQSREIESIELSEGKEGAPPYLKVCEINEEVGRGVFATSNIKKGTVIGLYTGILELVPKTDQEVSSYVYNLTANIDAQSFSVPPDQIHCVTRVALDEEGNVLSRSAKGEGFIIQVNAEKMGNYTRRINHGQASNVSPQLVKFEDGRIEVLLTASKSIRAGDQLLLDYGAEYWKALGIVPEEIKSDTYRLENDQIVEKKTLKRKYESIESDSLTLPLSNSIKEKKVSPSDSSSVQRSTPKVKRKKIESIELVKPQPIKKPRLRTLSHKRQAAPTPEYQAFLQSLGVRGIRR